MSIKKNCCYQCKERVLGCHSKCKKYADYQKQLIKMHHAELNSRRCAKYTDYYKRGE